jgi:hypothetical protein
VDNDCKHLLINFSISICTPENLTSTPLTYSTDTHMLSSKMNFSLTTLSDVSFVVLDRFFATMYPSNSRQRRCPWTLLVLYTFHSTSTRPRPREVLHMTSLLNTYFCTLDHLLKGRCPPTDMYLAHCAICISATLREDSKSYPGILTIE